MRAISPTATLGILGGGQLGRMLALEAKRMGYSVAVLDPTPNSPCGQIADQQIVAPYADLDAVRRLGSLSDVVTYEFENVDVRAVELMERAGVRIRPGSHALRITQHRLREKRFLTEQNIPVTPFAAVENAEDLAAAAERLGLPGVIKTASGGYDGKGQAVVRTRAEAEEAFAALRGRELIWERFVPFVHELGIICARSESGAMVTYPVTRNIHEENILAFSIAPADVPAPVAARAREIAERIAVGLDFVGTFCVEFFLLSNGELLVNEIAPRPHNSGHYTIDACTLSQFEAQLRAVCDLPLPPPRMTSSAVMVNILGDGTGDHLMGVPELLSDPAVALHLYGKRHAVARRKMGHFTLLREPSAATAALLETAREARTRLSWGTKVLV
ncbi:5-(carboxyamino)imidazole ribonucleotide synthase [bacterium]|nr:MAG: 5-(carboxyamino)imidazole ribonucleotide synthase [bacterium]